MAYQEGHLVRPSQSRKELDILVKSRPEGVSMRTLMDLEIKNHWWFGPRMDIVDQVHARRWIGAYHIDPQTYIISPNFPNLPESQ